MLAGEIFGSVRASDIWPGWARRSDPLFRQAENEGSWCVLSFIPKTARQSRKDPSFHGQNGSFVGSSLGFAFDLLPPQQFSVDIGDLLQALFDLMVVLDPAADLLDLIGCHCAARPMLLVQGHTQIPDRPMPVAPGTLAVRVTAGQIAFH